MADDLLPTADPAGLLERAVAARVGQAAPVLRDWYRPAALRAQLAGHLGDEVDRVADAGFGAGLREAIGPRAAGSARVTDPLAWANRVLGLPGGGWALTGIRFRGMDPGRPFVDVVATDAAPDPDGLAELAGAVLDAYGDLAPRCLRVDVADPDAVVAGLDGDPRFGPGSAVDMYLVAGLVSELRDGSRAEPRVTLRPGEPSAAAALGADLYARLGRANPELTMWATAEDAGSLAECAGEGLLFDVLVDGAVAGVVAAVRWDAHGLAGFSVQELVLDPAHQGRGLARGVLGRLLEVLPARDGDVLWGSIHPQNTPSLRNALSVGRVVVGGYVWVTPAGLPGMPPTVTG